MLYMVLPSANWLGYMGYFSSGATEKQKKGWNNTIAIEGYGFWTLPLVERDPWVLFEEYANYLLQQFEGAIPMEQRVLDALEKSYGMDVSDLTSATYRRSELKANCTLATALKRLEKQGKISKKMVSRGWFRRWVYFIPFKGTD